MNKFLIKIFPVAASLFCMLPYALRAEGSVRTDLTTSPDSVVVLGQVVHRTAMDPVHSYGASKSNVIDSLPTSVPGVTVLLYNDNTWKYVKTNRYIADSEVFSRCWDVKLANPYKSPIDSLPEAWTLWLVDSLSSYHVPAMGKVTSKFGIRHGRRHQGVDISMPTGTPLYAAFDGKVRISDYMGGYGKVIIIRHNNGMETFYGHMSCLDKDSGDIVHAGDLIGMSGSTGRSTGPHLHFETRYDGLAFDPQRIINFENGDLRQRMMVLKRRYFDGASRYDQNFDDEFLNMEDDEKALEAKKKADAAAALKAQVWITIRKGDNLSTLARKYHTTVNTICRLNNMKNPDAIREGKRLRVR